MYNEDSILFTRTMQAINKNIQHMCNKKSGPFAGEDGWQKIVVCIVSDGRQKVNKDVLTVLSSMGVYQEGVCVPKFMNRDTGAHIFEFTTQIAVTDKMDVKTHRDGGVVPVQVLFCLKEKNQKKINSHRWFFNAFGPVLQPTSLESWAGYISVLPGAFSAYRYKALLGRPLAQYFKGEKLHDSGDVFQANMYLAEDRILCFELVAKKNEGWVLQYEKDSQAITDVPDNFPEFISQRRRWLNGSTFAMLYALGNVGQIYTSGQSFLRMIVFTLEFLYMAINFVFNYFSSPTFTLPSTSSWTISTNSSATLPSAPNGPCCRKPSTGACLARNCSARSLAPVLSVFRSVYILSITTTFIAALGNRPQAAKYIYLFAIWLFAAITALMFYMIVLSLARDWDSLKQGAENATRGDFSSADSNRFILTSVALGATYGMYFLASFLFREPWHMFTCFAQYLFLLPTYVNLLQIYAYSNISDVTWGTKGDNGPVVGKGVQVKKGEDGQEVADLELPSQNPADVSHAYQQRVQQLQQLKKVLAAGEQKEKSTLTSEDMFKQFRTIWLLIWIVFNGSLVAILIAPSSIGIEDGRGLRMTYLTGLFLAVAALSAVRFVGSCGYLISRGLCSPFKSRGNA
ncbi:chitin synthase-domain-containing protein, partial [Catenaria anguillulae PL171]